MKLLRTAIFWLHLALALTAAAIVLVMSVTGVILTYQRSITVWYEQRAFAVQPPSADATRLPIDALVTAAVAGQKLTPGNVTIRSNRSAPVEVNVGPIRFMDPYTGRVIAPDSPVRAFFRAVTDWHRYLGFRPGPARLRGRAVTGVANLLLLVLIATGLCLWWPALRWSAIRPVILFRRGLSGRPRDFNWHNVIGVWSAIPLAIIVLGGAMISYPWVGDLVVWLAGAGPAPSMAARPAAAPQRVGPWTPSPDQPSVESMVQTATSRMPEWKALTLTLPNTGLPILVGVIDRADSGRPQDRASIRLDARTGRLLAYEVYEELNRERTVRTFFRYAHTGEILGLAGQTIAGLVSAASVLMVWTGLSLAWRRFAAWRQRSSARRAAQPRAA